LSFSKRAICASTPLSCRSSRRIIRRTEGSGFLFLFLMRESKASIFSAVYERINRLSATDACECAPKTHLLLWMVTVTEPEGLSLSGTRHSVNFLLTYVGLSQSPCCIQTRSRSPNQRCAFCTARGACLETRREHPKRPTISVAGTVGGTAGPTTGTVTPLTKENYRSRSHEKDR
jgi:hypothetical protein